jgi:nitrite reductase/ring-hydroxylating ferredoxin subunit
MSADHDDRSDCPECPLVVDRRAFLVRTALATAATLATLGASPGDAFAAAVRHIAPLGSTGAQRSYGIPAEDGVYIDAGDDVILARWQGRAYAFSLKCPHRGTPLEWHANESRVFCPKHKARFRPDGAHDSGRASRDLDRYQIRRQGDTVIVDLGVRYRVDQNAAAWQAAMVQLA